MTLEDAFLTDIREHPCDDAPRLIYADWLEEQGSSARTDRANFIRLQCRLTQMGEHDPLRSGVQSEANALLNKHREKWMRPLRAVLPELSDKDVVFARGFPASVTLRRIKDLEHASRLASLAPFQEVRLDLGNNYIDSERALAIAQSPHLQHLTHLDLGGNYIGNEGARALAQSSHLQHLTHLDLEHNVIAIDGAQALAESPHLQHLTYLDLGYNSIGNAGAQALAQSSYLRNLTHLGLGENGISSSLRTAIESRLAARRGEGQGRG